MLQLENCGEMRIDNEEYASAIIIFKVLTTKLNVSSAFYSGNSLVDGAATAGSFRETMPPRLRPISVDATATAA